MDLQDRMSEADSKFEQLKTQRKEQEDIIATATNRSRELWDEMMRVQGDYRTLEELQADIEVSKVIKANKKATVIEAVAEKE